MHIILLLLCGLFIGFIMLSLGMGAALYIGCFITVFHLVDKTAAATALVTTLPALIIGTFFYYRKHTINIHTGNKLLIWALLGTFGGSLVIPYINKKYYQVIISIILIVLSLTILYKFWVSPHIKRKHRIFTNHTDQIIACFASVISGIMTGLAGMSGGGPLVAAMLLLNSPIATAAATSSYIRVWTTILGIGMHWDTMTIAWHPAIFMMIGTAVGAALSPIIMHKIDQTGKMRFTKFMKPLIALLLLFMGVKPFL